MLAIGVQEGAPMRLNLSDVAPMVFGAIVFLAAVVSVAMSL
jgi:hypothetical protein